MKNLSWYLLFVVSVILIIVSVMMLIGTIRPKTTTSEIQKIKSPEICKNISNYIKVCCINEHEFIVYSSLNGVSMVQNFDEGLRPVVCDRESPHETK